MEQFAAIDLGSNSFHLVVARKEDHALTVIDREREMVRLAAGLDQKNKISGKVSQRALACLARFGERLRGLDPDNVRIVGTNALRKAKNSRKFIQKAEQALGFPIEIISGVEEARLIYIGAAQTLQGDRGRRMVIDIGGGSTEIIVGDKAEPVFLQSLYMGCVSSSERFFPDGRYTRARMRRAIIAAQVELEPNVERLTHLEADDIIGTSGTARAIARVLGENGWSETGMTREGMETLVDKIVELGDLEHLQIEGLGLDRAPVFAGGVAVMMAIFRSLNLQFMRLSEGSLREGVLQDLIGRVLYQDRRAQTVLELMKRHHIDFQHATRVRDTTLELYDQVGPRFGLLPRERRLLGWAAQLHEIGLMIAHNQHHRHGGYVLEHMDLPGFSRQEQGALALMVRLHRRRFRVELFEESRYLRSDAISLMIRLLRIAVLVNRGRGPIELPPIGVKFNAKKRMTLQLPASWLDDHPLTAADLDDEVESLASVKLKLKIVSQ